MVVVYGVIGGLSRLPSLPHRLVIDSACVRLAANSRRCLRILVANIDRLLIARHAVVRSQCEILASSSSAMLKNFRCNQLHLAFSLKLHNHRCHHARGVILTACSRVGIICMLPSAGNLVLTVGRFPASIFTVAEADSEPFMAVRGFDVWPVEPLVQLSNRIR